MRLFLYFFLMMLLPVLVTAQNHKHDTLKRDTLLTHYFSLSPDFYLMHDSLEFSADVESFNGFSPLNSFACVASNGLLGSPYQTLWFPEHVHQLHIDYFDFFYKPDAYLFTRSGIPVFTDTLPFSVASYSNGYKREQYFDFLHSQPLTRQWHLTLDYRLIGSPGAYKNQKNSLSNFFAITNYHTKSERYHFTAGIIFNRIFQQENGGIKYQNEFVDTTVYDRALTDVYLYSAQNQMRQNDYFITNEIRFGGKKDGRHRLYLQHTFNLRRERHMYYDSFDPDSAYYSVWNTASTADSVNHYAFENSITMGNRYSKYLRWYADVFVSSDHVYNTGTDTLLSHKVLTAGVSWNFQNGFGLLIHGSTDVFPVSGGDREIHSEFISNDSLKWRPHLRFSYSMRSPRYFFFQYSGNHFSWQHDWQQSNTIMGMGGIAYKNIDLTAYFTRFSNYMYFNGSAFNQGGTGNALGIKASADVKFGRFYFVGTAGLQDVIHANYLNLPPWFAKVELAMRNSVFKKALTLKTGISAWINGLYYADAYNPALQIFYMQRQTKTGGFVYPTAFVRAQIKRAVVFVEIINFTAGFTKVNYWQIPGYPLPDRGFRFGVTWSFLN